MTFDDDLIFSWIAVPVGWGLLWGWLGYRLRDQIRALLDEWIEWRD